LIEQVNFLNSYFISMIFWFICICVCGLVSDLNSILQKMLVFHPRIGLWLFLGCFIKLVVNILWTH